jgi:hypothetical protein
MGPPRERLLEQESFDWNSQKTDATKLGVRATGYLDKIK